VGPPVFYIYNVYLGKGEGAGFHVNILLNVTGNNNIGKHMNKWIAILKRKVTKYDYSP